MHNLQAPPGTSDHDVHEKDLKASTDDTPKDFSSEINGSSKVDGDARRADHDQKKNDHHHHHKKSRGKNYETSSDDKKVRGDKKKRKKSREHEKKKSKKDRKDRSERDKEKKTSSKTGSVEKSPEDETAVVEKKEIDNSVEIEIDHRRASKDEVEEFEKSDTAGIETEAIAAPSLKKQSESQSFKRSDSVLDINLHADIDLDDYLAPEVSKWEREENKSTTSLDNSEMEVGNGDVKKNPEEKVTSEILKRAENAIFARAISAIRPMENKKAKSIQEHEVIAGKETPPTTSSVKRTDSGKDSKTQAFQVTIPTNETGSRSVEMKTSDGARDSSRLKKSPMKTSIKSRLGNKIIEKKSRSKSTSRSPKRRLQSDCTKVVRTSRDAGARSQAERLGREERYPSSENRRNKQLSSLIKVTHEARDSSRQSNSNSRVRPNDKRRSPLPEDRKGTTRRGRAGSRSRSASRHNMRRHDQRSNPDKNLVKPKEPTRSDEKSSKSADLLAGDSDKAKAKNPRHEPETYVKKRSRDPSSSSTSSSSSSGSQKHSKRHSKHKVKKKSRSLSVESNGNAKRKKSKKEKKSKKKKKSSRK